MAGTKIGGMKARDKNKQLYGDNFYRKIGAIGGHNGRTGGFAAETIGKDGLTGRARASKVGKIGGLISRRGPKEDSYGG